MLPASVEPTVHTNSLNLPRPPGIEKPSTRAVYEPAVGFKRLTSSSVVPPPLEPTTDEPLYTTRSRSVPAGLTESSNNAIRASVVPAGIVNANDFC